MVDTAAGDLGKPYELPMPTDAQRPETSSRSHLQTVVDSIDCQVCLLDERGRILWVNNAWHHYAISNGGDPRRCSVGVDYFAGRTAEEPALSPPMQAVVRSLLDVVAGHRDQFEAECECQAPSGQRWFLTRAIGRLIEGNRRTIISHEDITERKMAEAERATALQQQMERRRVEAIGALANGIAHDFNNVLAAIIGNVELARRQALPNSLLRDLIDEIGSAGERARGLVQQILSFHTRRDGPQQPLPLAPLIEEAVAMLRATAAKRLSIELRLDQIPPLCFDPNQIHQVLLNLLTNAAYAVNASIGNVRVELAIANKPDSTNPGSDGERCARIRISDNGIGIAADVLPRIFDAYFTTKPAGKGNGLGLSVAQAIVRDHGGIIAVQSTVGEGTTFDVYLPYGANTAQPRKP